MYFGQFRRINKEEKWVEVIGTLRPQTWKSLTMQSFNLNEWKERIKGRLKAKRMIAKQSTENAYLLNLIEHYCK